MTAVSPHDAPQYLNMLLGQLFTNKITDPRLLEILAEVPREKFVPSNVKSAAYIDEDIEIVPGHYMLAPLTFARLLQLAEITPSCRVLIVGGANGYAASVIAPLAGHVVSINTDVGFTQKTAALQLADTDAQHVKNLADGYAQSQPYDVILLNGAVEYVPDALASQLAIGGRLVAIKQVANRPGVGGGLGKIIQAKRLDDQLNIREHFDACAPLLPGFKQTDQFDF